MGKKCGERVSSKVIDTYIEDVNGGSPNLSRDKIEKRIVDAYKHPIKTVESCGDYSCVLVQFRNGNTNRRHCLVYCQNQIDEMLSETEYNEKYG